MDTSILRVLLGTGLGLLGACNSASAPQPPGPAQTAPEAGSQGGAAAPGTGGGGVPSDMGAGAAAPYRISSRALVQWKRHAAFEADLMDALQLSRDQLCVEVGGKNCIRDVHLVPMGGNEPYESGLMKPSAEPLATTSSVVDRVLLSACSARARLDAEGAPQVFTALDLHGPLPPPHDPAIATTIRDLYRRLLARDPAPREVELVSGLAAVEAGGFAGQPNTGEGALSTRDFATLSCFTIGSTTEFLFF
jgi:hypothetical protein